MIPAEVRAAAVSVVRGVLGMEITHKPRSRLRAIATQFLLGIAGLALITFVCFQVGFGLARTGFAYVILVALVSLLGSFSTSVVLSLVAAVCLHYFFAPPLFELRVDSADDSLDPADWAAFRRRGRWSPNHKEAGMTRQDKAGQQRSAGQGRCTSHDKLLAFVAVWWSPQ